MEKRVIYYSDELSDDFAGTHIDTRPLRPEYCYLRNGLLWKAAELPLYYLIARPLIFLYTRLVYRQRFGNRAVMRTLRSSGAFVYANHTNALLDAFVPALLPGGRRGYIVVGPDAMSIPGLNGLLTMLGAIPLGDTMHQKREMLRCIRTRVDQRALVTIYPEAHIWPYYTGIRPYPADSFFYPVYMDAPVCALTNCYQRRCTGRRPKVVSYLDGPFYPDKSLPTAQRREKLRQECYDAMISRAETYSTYEYVRYRAGER